MRTSDGDVESVVKRKTVATWIEKLLGVPVAVSSDYSFRTCLRDGVLLCYLVNCLKPGSIREVTRECGDNNKARCMVLRRIYVS